MSILGTRVVRVEDPGFLTRGAVYTDDLVDDRLAGAVVCDLRALAGSARADHRRRHLGGGNGAPAWSPS